MNGKRAKMIREEMLAQGFHWKHNRRLYRKAKKLITQGKM
jgi:hypothetical protein